MKKFIATALVLLLALTAIPMTASAGSLSEETYYAIKATTLPVIDGIIDDCWENANVASVLKWGANVYPATSNPTSHKTNPVASAEMRVMWAEDCIYVLGVVTDPTPVKNPTQGGDENVDGVDIQISEGNDPDGTMRDDTVGEDNNWPGNGIFNVNINGDATGWGGIWFADDGGSKCESAATDWENGYIFEIMIPLQTTTGYVGKTIGLEFQINDNQKGAGRTAIRQWSCKQCLAHSDAKYLGTCIFVENAGDELPPETKAPETFPPEITFEEETDAPTEPPATNAPATDAVTTGKSDKDESKSGCGSVIAAPVLLMAVALAAPIVCKRKKD